MVTPAVEDGAAWLDARSPGWWRRIDLNTLDMESNVECVLGQLNGGFVKVMADQRLSRAQLSELGFICKSGEPCYCSRLTDGWKEVIVERILLDHLPEEENLGGVHSGKGT